MPTLAIFQLYRSGDKMKKKNEKTHCRQFQNPIKNRSTRQNRHPQHKHTGPLTHFPGLAQTLIKRREVQLVLWAQTSPSHKRVLYQPLHIKLIKFNVYYIKP
jgi:hypothetical protein